MNKAVFLDRDGTINVDKGYVYRIEDFEFLPGVIEALRLFQSMGYLLIIITNQSGIGRGYYTEDDLIKLTEYMNQELLKEGIKVTDFFYCPHIENASVEHYRKKCNCRKPSIELFLKAQEKWNIDWAKSYAVGDKFRDCTICNSTLCHGFIISNRNEWKKAENLGCVENIEYADSLLKMAMKIVERNRINEK